MTLKQFPLLRRWFGARRFAAGRVLILPDSACLSHLKLIFAVLSLTLLTACASHSEVPVKSVYQSHQCAIAESKLVFLDSMEQVYAFVESAKRLQVSAGKTTLAPPSADSRVVAVAWGHRPSSGYRLELNADTAEITEDTLYLPVSFVSPDAGQTSAQVITSPCIVVSVASHEGYQWVQAGELRMAIPADKD